MFEDMELTGLNVTAAYCFVLRLNPSPAFSDSKYAYDIFKYARMAIDPNVELVRFEMPKSGLLLFSRHASQFSQYLVDDYKVCTHCMFAGTCPCMSVNVCVQFRLV